MSKEVNKEEDNQRVEQILKPIQDKMFELHTFLSTIPNFEDEAEINKYEVMVMDKVDKVVKILSESVQSKDIALPFATFTLMGLIEMLLAHPMGDPTKIIEEFNKADEMSPDTVAKNKDEGDFKGV